jgi:endonuclease/exonuclease/phosphatase family metal-dependent hydrolase
MQQEIRFATFNVCNLALPGMRFYDGIAPYTPEEYDTRVNWLAQQLDRLDADVIGLQEVFSQDALREVLARTQRYRDAWHAWTEPALLEGKLTPGVALISRIKASAPGTIHHALPRGLSFSLPGKDGSVTSFTRPVLHARLQLGPERLLHLFVLHLKSQRPDLVDGDEENDAGAAGMAMLRSLLRRGIDAVGVRCLVEDALAEAAAPVMVMGDFNDDADAVTTRIAMFQPADEPWRGLRHCSRLGARPDPLRNPGYSYVHGGRHDTIDHVLVSEEFDPASENAIAETIEVAYLNDHLSIPTPGASDHGAVLVRVRFRQDL